MSVPLRHRAGNPDSRQNRGVFPSFRLKATPLVTLEKGMSLTGQAVVKRVRGPVICFARVRWRKDIQAKIGSRLTLGASLHQILVSGFAEV